MAKQGDGAAQAARDEQLDDASLADAIEATEREIFDDAMGEEPAENDGDTSLEQEDDPLGGDPEGEDEDEAEGEGEAEAELSPEAEIDDGEAPIAEPERPQRRGDPAVALREERDRRQALERELAELRGRIDGVAQAVRQPVQAETPPERPDMFVDPEGYTAAIRAEAAAKAVEEVRSQQIQAAMEEAHAEYGDEFAVAWNHWNGLPDSSPEKRAIGLRMGRSTNPGRLLMQWAEPLLQDYRGQRAQQQAEQFDRMLEENPDFREHVIARLRGGQRQPAGQRQPPTQQLTPRRSLPSLNSAGGSSSQRVGADPRGFDGSESSIFEYAFEK